MDEVCPASRALSPPVPGFVSSYPTQEAFYIRDIAAGGATGDFYGKAEWVEKVEAARNSRLISNWWIEVPQCFFTTKILSISILGSRT